MPSPLRKKKMSTYYRVRVYGGVLGLVSVDAGVRHEKHEYIFHATNLMYCALSAVPTIFMYNALNMLHSDHNSIPCFVLSID